jgi:4-amino-4-deoxy-L-arabinose transferase-like glycosyltransferase/peptidoglycan/xylan/chitin deacetylase (PgdA/CDA1 family)
VRSFAANPLVHVAIGLVVGVAVLMPPLEGPLPIDNDALFAEAVRDVRESGHWLAPTVQGYPFVEKPPLHFWMATLSTMALGETELALRLPSLLFALATLVLVLLFTRRESGSWIGGWLAYASLLGAHQFFEYAHRVMLDGPLTFFCAAGIFAIHRAVRSGNDRLLAWAGVAFGLGFMEKSLAALVVPAAGLAIVAVAGAWRLLLSRGALYASLSAVVLIVPWHAWAWVTHERVFVEALFGLHVRDQLLEAQPWSTGGALFYVTALAKEELLFALTSLAGVLVALRRARRKRDRHDGAMLLALAFLAILLLASLSATKKTYYVLPAYPLAAVVLGLVLAGADRALSLSKHRVARPLRALPFAILAAILAHNHYAADEPAGARDAEMCRTLANAMRRDSQPGDVLRTLEVYQTSLQFYARRKTIELTSDRGHLRNLRRIPYIRDVGTAASTTPKDLRALLESRERVWLLGTPEGLLRFGKGLERLRWVAFSGRFALARNFIRERDDRALTTIAALQRGLVGTGGMAARRAIAAELEAYGRITEANDARRAILASVEGETPGVRESAGTRLALGLYYLDQPREALALWTRLRLPVRGAIVREVHADLELRYGDRARGLAGLRELVSDPDTTWPTIPTLLDARTDPPRTTRAPNGSPIPALRTDVALTLGDSRFAAYLPELLGAEGLRPTPWDGVKTLPAETRIVLLGARAKVETARVRRLLDSGVAVVALAPATELARELGVELRPVLGATTIEAGTAKFRIEGAGTFAVVAPGARVLARYAPHGEPAAAVVARGRAHAAVIGFDLTTSTALVRQGNPAHAGLERDGLPGLTANDLYAGVWKQADVSIPHADRAVALLADTIAAVSPHPMARIWPHAGARPATLLLTADQDWAAGELIEAMAVRLEAKGARATFFLTSGTQASEFQLGAYRLTPPTPALARRLLAAGHELSIHTNTTAAAPTYAHHKAIIGAHLRRFQEAYGVAPRTARLHRTLHAGWVDTARALAELGVSLDLNSIGLADVEKRRLGYLEGSGRAVRLIDESGRVLPIKKLPTVLDDHPLSSATLASRDRPLDTNAIVKLGHDELVRMARDIVRSAATEHYAALVVNHHPIHFAHDPSWLEAILDAANAHGVRVQTAQTYLDYLRAAETASVTTRSFDGETLRLTVDAPEGPVTLLLPRNPSGRPPRRVRVSNADVPLRTVAPGVLVALPKGSTRVQVSY